MSWNYRVFKEDGGYSIREVYYKDGVLDTYSRDMAVASPTKSGLRTEINKLTESLHKPEVSEVDFEIK